MPLPYVTIAMPCLNEAGFIEECLRSIQAQSYPRDRFGILVADGGSSDGTREILARLAREDDRIHIIYNPERLQAPGLNRILRQARGDVIVRMDVHCEYAPNYVEKCVEVLERTGADNVGGAQRCLARTPFQQAVCTALRSPLGVGGAAYRDPGKEGFVDTVFLGAFRRGVFEKVGLYDPQAVTNEDAELNQRIIAAGGRIYLSREIEVHYRPRESFRALARQYFRYGRGRARTLLKHRRFLTVRPALPFLGVTAGILSLVALPWTRALLPFAALVALATGIEAVRVGAAGGVAHVLRVWTILPLIVVSHGVGFGVGLARYVPAPDWEPRKRTAG